MSLKIYKAEVTRAISGALSPVGYRRKRANFIRLDEHGIRFIQIQSSSWSSQAQFVFTINLGFFSPELAAAAEERTEGIGIIHSHWGSRLGTLMPRSQDYWWWVDSQEKAVGAGKEAAAALVDFGLPELERMSNLEALKDLWESGRSPGLTARQVDRYQAALSGLR